MLSRLGLTEIETLQRTLDEFRLSMAEYVMLHLIRFQNRPVLEAPAYALALLKQTRIARYLPTEEECSDSIGRLCRRGLTEIVDLPTLKRVRKHLSTFEGIGPTGGLPLIGELDFTLEGAETCRAILNSQRSDNERDYFWFHTGAFIYRRNAIKLIGYDLNQMLHEVKWRPNGEAEWGHTFLGGLLEHSRQN